MATEPHPSGAWPPNKVALAAAETTAVVVAMMADNVVVVA